MSPEEKEKRKKLFGKFSDGLQSLKPYRWQIGERSLIEIPVTTLPVFKTPIHASYVIYLSTFSKTLARTYWKTAIEMCRATGTELSLLLHPLDFLSGEDAPELKFFPAMNLPADEKLEFLSEILEIFAGKFEVVNLSRHAREAAKRNLRAVISKTETPAGKSAEEMQSEIG
jgi:peptidoglycan-N-acetylglucosamine deacetylase